ncbi:hypothetical protein LY78DRAFT_589914, partial [Colletotrichum sublineola]
WVVVHGQVWDVTNFLDKHPGGVKLIIQCANRDATEDYNSIHNPNLTTEILSLDYCLGPVDPFTLAKTRSPTKPEKPKLTYPPLCAIINADDFERVAEKYFSPTGWAYYSFGGIGLAECWSDVG